MKKLFLLIPTLLLTVALNAAVININTETADALRLALNSAADGDIIEMAAGTYVESNENYIAFTGKAVTVRAAEGAEVILQPQVPITISEGGCAHFENVKIDASRLTELANWYEHVIYPTDAAVGNRIILEGCEIYGFALNKSLISCSASAALDALTINNCYFHNINKSCVFIENTTNSIDINITNSTFANITTDATSYYAGVIDTRATSGSFLVDHCTFYNVEAMSTGYAAIGQVKLSSGAIVSNCIFALSASGASTNRTIRDKITAKNCLVYNYTTDSNYGMQSDVMKENCIKEKDPLFADAANGNFSLAGDWVTPSISPARGAATDGSDLGDPRWAVAETLPSTDFASPYILLGGKALLSGNIELNANDHIAYKGSSEPGIATWKIHIEKACAISAIADRESASTSGCTLKLTAYDTNGNEVSAISAARSDNDNDINFSGCLYIATEGDYTFKLTNSVGWSSAIIEKITLSYMGGAVQNISASANTTLDISEAWFSGCTRGLTGITYPVSETASAWIKWNIATEGTKAYDITANINTTQAHEFAVNIYEDENSAPVATAAESGYTDTQGSPLALALGRVNLAGGKNYVVKVTNITSGSQAELINIVFAPVAASATELPNTLAFSNAVLSTKAHITDDKLYFNEIGDTNPQGQWARWAVTTDHDGLFLFTLNVYSENGQSYKISIFDDSDNLIDSYDANPGSGAKTLKHYFQLSEGAYSVKVENTTSFSKGHLISFAVTEPDDIITLDENADNSSVISGNKEGAKTIQLIRTIKGGSFNTLCLPFAVSSTMCKDIFGADVEILTLKETSIDNTTLDLVFNNASDIWQGTPVLIMPSRDIVNPVFENVTIQAEAPATSTSRYTNFVGTFNPTSIEASPNNLFLGPNNTLYFPENNAQPIKGLRGWFVLHDAPASIIQRARIVQNSQVVTAIELTKESDNNLKAQKVLHDGQLIIIRNGVRYSIQGQRIQ